MEHRDEYFTVVHNRCVVITKKRFEDLIRTEEKYNALVDILEQLDVDLHKQSEKYE